MEILQIVLKLVIFILCILIGTSNSYCPKNCNKIKQGYLNVHIICHTHLDTGWVNTYQEYYDGYVKQIYNSVIENLQINRLRRFIAVETSFFMKWYDEQSLHTKQIVQKLVRDGQLEFINGAWSMNDEATAYYRDIIDDFTVGHQLLNKTFGICALPKIGWQIDPFGHSREHASILSQMQFNGLFLGRIDFQDKIEREKSKSLEFIWKTSPSLGDQSDLFTSVLPNVYWPPTGFCFDINCYDDPINNYNAPKKAREFIDIIKNQAQNYATQNTIITMGMDFYYRDAKKWFDNIEILMKEINDYGHREKINILYSTPECYLEALKVQDNSEATIIYSTSKESKVHWPVKIDDFFPYADALNAYWTGFYSSRPALKLHVKEASNLLNTAKQLAVLSRIDRDHSLVKLQPLKESVALLQHHDGITGTCKQYVAEDYHTMLSRSMHVAQEFIADCLTLLMAKRGIGFSGLNSLQSSPPRMQFCNKLNTSNCVLTEDFFIKNQSAALLVTVYNPIAHELKRYLRIPIGQASNVFIVQDNSENKNLESQVAPVAHKLTIHRNYVPSELIFKAVLPPLGFSSFIIKNVYSSENLNTIHSSASIFSETNTIYPSLNNNPYKFYIGNNQLSLEFDSETGLIQSVQILDPSTGSLLNKIQLTQNFFIYQSKERSYFNNKPSGAYRFSPINNEVKPVSNSTKYKVFRGVEVDEVHQVFNSWVTQVVRVYKQLNSIEFDWKIGPIPISIYYDNGYEIITRFDTNLQTNSTFFTDSNGRETLRRIRDYRPTFSIETTEKYSSNYYPVTSWAFIHDHQTNQQVTILPDRSVGCTSSKSGSIEFMLHRRLLHDDGYGMEEALNEPGEDGQGLVVRGKTQLIVGSIQESVKQMRILSKIINNQPIMAFKTLFNDAIFNEVYIGIKRKIPPNIHILTLEPWDADTVLLRLEHFFEINEDSQYSHSKRIDLRDLFTNFDVIDYKEMTLNGVQNKWISETNRMKFHAQFNPYSGFANMFVSMEDNDSIPPFTILLKPMEIRTFLINLREK